MTTSVLQYGDLRVRCDVALPELPTAEDGAAVDIDISGAPLVIARSHVPGWTSRSTSDGGHQFTWGRSLAFACSSDLANVRYWRSEELSDESFRHGLLDYLLPRLLAARGQLVLHAACIEVDHPHGRSQIVVVGSSGVGKSTICAFALSKGYHVLSDDSLLIDSRGPRARATYPGVRLHADSYDTLSPTIDMVHLSRPAAAGKLFVPIEPRAPECNTTAIVKLVVLRSSSGGSGETSPRCETVSGSEALLAVHEATFRPDNNLSAADQSLRQVADLLATTPCWTLTHEQRWSDLPAVLELLVS